MGRRLMGRRVFPWSFVASREPIPTYHLGKRARFAAGLIIEHVNHDGGAEKLPTAEPIRMRRCHVGSTLVTRNCYKTCVVFCMERFLAEKTNIAWERGCPPKG